MLQYVLKRLLLILPTVLGIVLMTFAVTQFVPGGPVEQAIHEFRAQRRGGGEAGSTVVNATADLNRGDRSGLEREQVEYLKKLYGFDKPWYDRLMLTVKNLFTFNFGQSYFRQKSVVEVFVEKMPVSISLGVWSFFLTYLVCIPLGITKALKQGTRFDAVTSVVVLVAYSIPGFVLGLALLVLFGGGSFLAWFPMRGLTSDNWETLSLGGKILDYMWHMVLPLIAYMVHSFAVLTLMTRNLFLEEINHQYVQTARAKGMTEKVVLFKHVFRNAMIIIIAGVPGAFVAMFFSGALLIETMFSLDGLGLLMYESVMRRDYPIVMANLFVFSIVGLVMKIISDLTLVLVDPRISFDKAAG